MSQLRIRDFGIDIGTLSTGRRNAITDVEGVRVGHCTLSERSTQTGVTAILPHEGNIFKEKLIASNHIINGFGKTMGTVQMNELGTLETPILLTNTLGIGTASEALIEYMLERTPEIGRSTGSVNPVVGECNDMILNDIRDLSIEKEHVVQALEDASSEFPEGSVGAGRGMVCYSLKGGVGSSSRLVELHHGTYTIGVLVLTNFGRMGDLLVNGRPVGEQLSRHVEVSNEADKGSVMVVVATDLPVSERQLNRIIKRSVTGLSRTGSLITTGSGDVVIGFSTAAKIPYKADTPLLSFQTIHEEDIDEAFRAVSEATEEAVLNSLITADSVTGRDGNKAQALRSLLEKYPVTLL
ncbi:aminopeptidase [Halobacillus halophilus]|uniref:S58/DmpA family peptidase n=1 Tax=Halobacillus halophilus (strain ATCC 35676 / DSM 2266 / JCM 20832 / KCTC 3685 / LMG 17431 / NBRC 102448 / NCIMB 2269) TaxID=866895 RepID=I0JT49_HALH3|nr:P1 family peptidase [Halobacillus halophilus]ASF41237.1 aminopeptidase [Halobacillus halophilus]CCG47321.1 S58/DmpA family peptidase [Halobacillus halophilus DSM 2266]